MNFKLTSTTFSHTARIPDKFTCAGEDISPALKWEGAPTETKSFALIIDDPDVPIEINPLGIWDHCMIYNIPSFITEFSEGEINRDLSLKHSRILFLNNGWGKKEYGGPCPPPGKNHRYFFKLYALDNFLQLDPASTKQELLSAMKGHILAQTELVGTYSK